MSVTFTFSEKGVLKNVTLPLFFRGSWSVYYTNVLIIFIPFPGLLLPQEAGMQFIRLTKKNPEYCLFLLGNMYSIFLY